MVNQENVRMSTENVFIFILYLLPVSNSPHTSMIVKQPQRYSIYLALWIKVHTFVIAMHLRQTMTLMVLFQIIVESEFAKPS